MWIAISMCAVLVVLAAIGEARRPLNPDAAWLLYSAERILRGERLYVDVLEINPPLIVWLNLPLVVISHGLGLAGPMVLHTAMFAVALASGCACAALARRWWVMVATAFVLLPLAGGMFGQREHLALALMLPFVWLTALRITGGEVRWPVAAAIGAAGAMGMALKPHYGAVWLALLVYRWWAGGRRQPRGLPEDWSVLALGVLYPAAVLLLTPEYFAFVAGAARDYLSYGSRTTGYVLLGHSPAWWFYLALAAWLLFGPGPRQDPAGGALAAAGIGFLVAVAAQHKGWSYHYYPLTGCAFLLAVATVVNGRVPTRTGLAGLARSTGWGIYAALLLGFTVAQTAAASERAAGALSPRELRQVAVREAVRGRRDARTILVLSSQLRDAFPLVNDTGLRWVAGYPNMWFTVVYYGSDVRPSGFHQVGEMSSPERAAFARVVRDFVDGKPDVLIVESRGLNQRRTGISGGFDFLAYFGQDPGFAAGVGSYRQEAEVDGLVLFRRLPAFARR